MWHAYVFNLFTNLKESFQAVSQQRQSFFTYNSRQHVIDFHGADSSVLISLFLVSLESRSYPSFV